jgi:hypothetical protein
MDQSRYLFLTDSISNTIKLVIITKVDLDVIHKQQSHVLFI